MPVFRMELHFLNLSQQMENVLYYQSIGASGTSADLVDGWITDTFPFLRVFIAQSCVLTEIKCVNVTEGTEYINPVALGGNTAGDQVPPTCAALLSLKTNYTSRSKQGRVYVPGVMEGMQLNGILNSPALAALTTFGNALLSVNSVEDNYDLVIFSRKLGTCTKVDTVLPRQYLATQRRRGYGRGI